MRLSVVQDQMALDSESSSRTRDEDGHLHVRDCPITKAGVNPYLGREVVDWQALGLDPDKVYYLLRDPAELEMGASSFNGKPLLSVHKPQQAQDHSHQLTVGSVGEPYWDDPYVRVKDLHVWDQDSIDGIDSGEQKQLSAGYRYKPVLESGTYRGQPYNIRMTDIRGNHVALVPKGRAGSDVVVGDSLPLQLMTKEPDAMTAAKPILSRKAALAKGALSLHLRPKLAQDAVLDLNAVLAGVTAKNFKTTKAEVLTRLKTLTAGKLAQDADLGDVADLLDAIEKMDGGPDDSVAAVRDPESSTATDDSTMDKDAMKEFLRGKLSPEDHSRACQMMGAEPDAATDDDMTPGKDKMAKDDKSTPGKPATGEPPVTKQAMDAAIATASAAAARAAETATIARLRGVQDAEREVKPYVGELAVAMDSAEAVYRFALDALKVENADVREVPALRRILLSQPKPGESRPRTPAVALDAAGAATFRERFPDSARLVK